MNHQDGKQVGAALVVLYDNGWCSAADHAGEFRRNMLYSSSDNWRKERSWILKFLADAMLGAGDDEWRVFKRRHTWDLLASLFQSRRQDRALRNEILEARPRFVLLW